MLWHNKPLDQIVHGTYEDRKDPVFGISWLGTSDDPRIQQRARQALKRKQRQTQQRQGQQQEQQQQQQQQHNSQQRHQLLQHPPQQRVPSGSQRQPVCKCRIESIDNSGGDDGDDDNDNDAAAAANAAAIGNASYDDDDDGDDDDDDNYDCDDGTMDVRHDCGSIYAPRRHIEAASAPSAAAASSNPGTQAVVARVAAKWLRVYLPRATTLLAQCFLPRRQVHNGQSSRRAGHDECSSHQRSEQIPAGRRFRTRSKPCHRMVNRSRQTPRICGPSSTSNNEVELLLEAAGSGALLKSITVRANVDTRELLTQCVNALRHDIGSRRLPRFFSGHGGPELCNFTRPIQEYGLVNTGDAVSVSWETQQQKRKRIEFALGKGARVNLAAWFKDAQVQTVRLHQAIHSCDPAGVMSLLLLQPFDAPFCRKTCFEKNYRMLVDMAIEDNLPCKDAMIGLAREFVGAQQFDPSVSSSAGQLNNQVHCRASNSTNHEPFTKKCVKTMKTATLKETLGSLGESRHGTRKELIARLMPHAIDFTTS